MQLVAAFIIIALTLCLLVRQVEVRLVLMGAGLALATVALKPIVVFEVFLAEIGNGKTIGPICSAMGYGLVLRATGCDRAMVRALLKPLRRAGWLLLPGGCAVAFLTNIAINSQTAAAVAVGPILVPLLLAAGFPPVVAAATLLLGSSCGNLCNPGEADLVAIHDASLAPMPDILAAIVPPVLGGFVTFVAIFTVMPGLRGAELATGVDLGVLGAIAANYGRTVSPVAAVVIFSCTLAGVAVPVVIKKMLLPLAAGFAVAFLIVVLRAG